jgi:hypothetical protein
MCEMVVMTSSSRDDIEVYIHKLRRERVKQAHCARIAIYAKALLGCFVDTTKEPRYE